MIYVAWFIFSILTGMFASSRGRSGFGWFVLALLISPLIAAIMVAVLPAQNRSVEEQQIAQGTMRKCPVCAELIRPEAIKCRFCGSAVPAAAPLAPDEVAQRHYGG